MLDLFKGGIMRYFFILFAIFITTIISNLVFSDDQLTRSQAITFLTSEVIEPNEYLDYYSAFGPQEILSVGDYVKSGGPEYIIKFIDGEEVRSLIEKRRLLFALLTNCFCDNMKTCQFFIDNVIVQYLTGSNGNTPFPKPGAKKSHKMNIHQR